MTLSRKGWFKNKVAAASVPLFSGRCALFASSGKRVLLHRLFWTGLLTATALGFAAPAPDPAALPPRAASAGGLDTVRAFSQASQDLYRKIAPSLVHVRPEVQPDQLVPESLRKGYQEFKAANGTAIPLGPRADSAGASPRHETAAPRGPATQRSGRVNELVTRPREFGVLRRFLEQQAAAGKLEPDTAMQIRQSLAKIDLLRQGQGLDLIGIIIDNDGHALVHAPLFNSADKKLPVILPDGTESTATVQGTDVLRGLCIITLAKHGGTPLPMAPAGPTPGEVLLMLSINHAALNWVTTAAPTEHPLYNRAQGRSDITFITGGGEEHWPGYLINLSGQLVALNWNRRATAMTGITHDIDALIKKEPLQRQQIGVSYVLVDPDSPLREEHPALGLQPAVVVNDVTAGTPAARAGLVKGDFILKIDHKPINQLMRILADMRTRPGEVDVDIIRNNQPQTLKMTLEHPQ